jgi:hypothetical protein
VKGLRLGTVLAVASALWIGAACAGSSPQAVASPTASSSPAASPSGCPGGQTAIPSGFPADFPIYPGTQLTAACKVPGNASTQWTVQWQTTANLNDIQAFYVDALNKGDWVLLAYSGDINTRFSATLQRNSNANVKGSLEVKNSGGPTTIALALTTVP